MSEYEKFPQRWQFRRTEHDADSSSDDDKSNSGDNAVQKKRKLASNFVLPKNKEACGIPSPQVKRQCRRTKVGSSRPLKAAKKNPKSREKKNARNRKSGKDLVGSKKRKRRTQSPKELSCLDDLNVFRESLTEELRVDTENMLSKMTEEMSKLVPSKSSLKPEKRHKTHSQKNEGKHQNKTDPGNKVQSSCAVSTGNLVKTNIVASSSVFQTEAEERMDHDQVARLLETNELDKGERLNLLATKPGDLYIDSDQVVSVPYRSLPPLLPKPQLQNHKISVPLNDHIQTGLAGKSPCLEMGKEVLMNEKNNQYRFPAPTFFPGEQLQSFSQMSSSRIGFDAQNSDQTSSISTSFPVPLHQGLSNICSGSSKTYLESPFQLNNKLNPNPNAAVVGVSGGNCNLPEQFFHNSMSGHMS